jgi:hypothetical protein
LIPSNNVNINVTNSNVTLTNANITTANITTANITGVATFFTTQLNVGAWIGNTTGSNVGIIKAIANNTSLTLTANASVAIANTTARYNPFGVAYTVATANSEFIPPNTIMNSVIVGQGNIVSFLEVTGVTSALFTIKELGMPHANTGTTGVLPTPNLGGPTT